MRWFAKPYVRVVQLPTNTFRKDTKREERETWKFHANI